MYRLSIAIIFNFLATANDKPTWEESTAASIAVGCVLVISILFPVALANAFAIISESFGLDISRQTVMITGLIAGAMGGLLLGWLAYRLIRLVLNWAMQKMAGNR